MTKLGTHVISLKDRPLEDAPSPAPLPPSPPPAPAPKKRSSLVSKIVPIVAVVLLGAGCGAAFFSFTRPALTPPAGNAAAAAETNKQSGVPSDDADAIVAAVGRIMLLPAGERPTLARVTNLDNLRGESFFDNAAIGDVVLMYKGALKAILYRPSENKIIEVAPISTSSPSTAHL